MSVSMRDLDPSFQGAGKEAGIEIWRIENFKPVLVQKSSHGKFFTGDSYIVLKTTALKSGALSHNIHYWLGKDTSQDESGAAAIKTVELDAALGGRAVQYREVQGHETERFLSYFKPCIIPQEGGIASGFKHPEEEEYKVRLYVCKGKHVVHVKEVLFARSTLNHDDIFIVDTKSKIFQFNGSNSSIQERAKALEVVQYIKDTYHDGKCEIATIEDGKLMADAESGEFWGLFGGFAPLPRKTASDDSKKAEDIPTTLYSMEKGQPERVEADSLTRELLDTSRCYLLDCGEEIFVWLGRSTSLDKRKTASGAADEFVRGLDRPRSHIIRVIEGFETVMFRSKFDSWPQSTKVAVTEDGRGKVAALLQRQGVNVKGLLKSTPSKEEPQLYIDCTGNLQVWRVNGQEKTLLSASEQSKFFSGDCYVFQYSYPGQDTDEVLIGTWFGKQSVEDERASATAQASKMVESLKFMATQARIYEGNEPIQFFAIFQSFIVYKGGISEGYKKHMAANELQDDTYSEDGVALFRIQGTGPENMQAIQVEPSASSLNSSYCFILHSGSTVLTWNGNLTSSEDQELVERLLDLIKPNMQTKLQKEGAETDQFWELLGGKSEYSSQKIARDAESDPHLFSASYLKGDLKVKEIYNFNQDDLMTEDMFIVDCHSDIFVWVGKEVDSKNKLHALVVGEKFLEHDFLLEKLSHHAPIYIVMEGSEPSFFTRFFTWDSKKSAMHGNSFQRKLAIVKNGGPPVLDKPKRRAPVSYGGRSAAPEKPQRSRSVSSFSPDRVRVRGRSPAFNALAANFENPSARNLSTPPPMVRKIYPKSGSATPDSSTPAPKSAAIAALTSSFDKPAPAREFLIPRSAKASAEAPKSERKTDGDDSVNNNAEAPKSEPKADGDDSVNNNAEAPKSEPKADEDDSVNNNAEPSKPKPETIHEDVKEDEAEDEEGLPIYPFERLRTDSTDPVADIDLTKRETYLSSTEFKEKFQMEKDAFYKLPKWKQNKLKMSLQLF
ncbi:non-motor actin binding protein [Lithospermum erythrorhizon]|uniref:Non-motor actin binding protein n=1 Tax=Lithospermum erythrorhizon TaxID=34254 RepID=A0AAV3PUU6_LITER